MNDKQSRKPVVELGINIVDPGWTVQAVSVDGWEWWLLSALLTRQHQLFNFLRRSLQERLDFFYPRGRHACGRGCD
ncbi:MAG: hypothetical protein JWP38_8 [Herbaspirillum sp.]|nr:hypothetical protein [Herbaspirillum sp.]